VIITWTVNFVARRWRTYYIGAPSAFRIRPPSSAATRRCNALRHGLTAETVIGALEDAEDYEAFEAAITVDYDAQSAVERELVLRLASILWRLRRATTMETGLFELQAQHLGDYQENSRVRAHSNDVIQAPFRRDDSTSGYWSFAQCPE